MASVEKRVRYHADRHQGRGKRTISCEEGDGGTVGTGTTSTTNTVDIVLRVVGVVVVQHMSNVANIFLQKVLVSKNKALVGKSNVAIEGPFLSRAGLDASLLSAWTSLKNIPEGSESMGWRCNHGPRGTLENAAWEQFKNNVEM